MLDIKRDDLTGIQVLSFAGEWDVFEKERAEDSLFEAVEQTPKAVIVDLSGITFLDSGGLASLIATYIKASDKGIPMAVIASDNNYPVQKFRELGLFDSINMMFFETLEEVMHHKWG